MRTDGRKSLLIYLKPDTIRELKKLAVDDDTHVYLLVEPLIESFLSERKAQPSRKKPPQRKPDNSSDDKAEQ